MNGKESRGRTSAKGNWKPKRQTLICPMCGKAFTMQFAEVRSLAKKGTTNPCCSMTCGHAIKRQRSAA